MLPYVQQVKKVTPYWVGSDCVRKATHTGSHDTCNGIPDEDSRRRRDVYRYELLAPLEFVDSGAYHHYIYAGFRWNGRSAPLWMPRYFDDPAGEAAWCLHDKLYRDPPLGMKRWDADRVMAEAMRASLVDWANVYLIDWPGVRIGGWRPWRKHRQRAAAQRTEETSQNLLAF